MRRTALLFALVLAAASGWMVLPVAAALPESKLTLTFQPETAVAQQVALGAYLLDPSGNPISGQPVVFSIDAEFMNTLDRVEVGTARTDATGLALLVYQFKLEGKRLVTARFAGSQVFAPAEASGEISVGPGPATYNEELPFRIPGASFFTIAAVLAAIWSLYLSVLVRFYLISRDAPPPDSRPRARMVR